MLLGVQGYGCRSGLGSFVDLLDESIDGFTGLDGHIFLLFQQIVVKLVEEVGIVL